MGVFDRAFKLTGRSAPSVGLRLLDISGCYSHRHPSFQVCQSFPRLRLPLQRTHSRPIRVGFLLCSFPSIAFKDVHGFKAPDCPFK